MCIHLRSVTERYSQEQDQMHTLSSVAACGVKMIGIPSALATVGLWLLLSLAVIIAFAVP